MIKMTRYSYKKIKLKDGSTRDRHRLVMEKHVGRKLSCDELVHHINGDVQDDRIENLEIVSRSAHAKYHMSRGDLYKVKPGTNKRVSNEEGKFKCTKCCKYKFKNEFKGDKKSPHGIGSRCKECRRINRRKFYLLHKK